MFLIGLIVLIGLAAAGSRAVAGSTPAAAITVAAAALWLFVNRQIEGPVVISFGTHGLTLSYLLSPIGVALGMSVLVASDWCWRSSWASRSH